MKSIILNEYVTLSAVEMSTELECPIYRLRSEYQLKLDFR